MMQVGNKVIKFKNVTHVMFDMDGLLLDTEHLYTQATQNIVQPFGKTYEWEQKMQIMGLTHVECAKAIVKLLDLPITWEEYHKQALEQYNILMPHAELMPDTESIFTSVIGSIAKQYGKLYTPEIRNKLLGTVTKDTCEIAVREMKIPISPEMFQKEFMAKTNIYLKNCSLLPGAERLVKHLHQHNIPIAVATSSSQRNMDLKIPNHKAIFNLFHHKVCGGSDPEVKQGKPSPDIFLVCASRFPDKPEPEKCLVFEDAPNGVMAAIAAGMQCVMVPDENIPQDLRSHATRVLNSLEEFKPEEFGLPPF